MLVKPAAFGTVQPKPASSLPIEIEMLISDHLSLKDLALLASVDRKRKESCVKAMVPISSALAKIKKKEDQYAASSLSELARKGGMPLDIRNRHNELVGHFKDLSGGRYDELVRHFRILPESDELRKCFSGKQKEIIEELSLSGDASSSQYRNQLEQLAELETLYNCRVLAHEIGRACGAELVSYGDLIKVELASDLKTLIEGFSKERVRDLYLKYDGLTALPEGVIGALENLEALDLTNNRLRELPGDVCTAELGQFRGLYLGNNELTQEARQVVVRNLKHFLVFWD